MTRPVATLRSRGVHYHWWPISFGWDSSPFSQPLWKWIYRAIESRFWTLDWPHRFTCLNSLEIHRAACLRPWHGWPIGDSSTEYGKTIHIGRFKIYFGRRG